MALTKITSAIIADGAITASAITDTSITADKLHTTLDLTGKSVTVATATAGDNDTTVASTAFVSTAIANLADSAPETLNTLNELAAALGDDANFSTTVTNSIALKAPLASPTFTGTLTASGLVYPTSDGTNGQALVTNGSGTLSFSTIQGYTDSDVETYLNTSEIYTDATNNRLGIGAASPDSKLHIDGNFDGPLVTIHNTGGATSAYAGLEVETSTTGSYVQRWLNAGTELMRVTGDGKVGIGDVPSSNATGSMSPRLFVDNNLGDGTLGLQIASYHPSIVLSDKSSGLHNYIISHDGGHFSIGYEGGTAGSSNSFTSRLKILSSGNVGIGTDNPSALLHIKTADPATNQAVIDFRNPTYGIFAQTNSIAARGNTLEFIASDYNNNSAQTHEVLTLRPEGNVGIGTDNPDVQLEVAGASGNASSFKLSGRPDWTSGNGQYHIGSIYGENLGAGVNTTRIKLDGDDTSGAIQFYTASGGTLTSAMYIDSNQNITMSGNVGIGTSDPKSTLQIEGGRMGIISTDSSWEQLRIANPNVAEAGIAFLNGATNTEFLSDTLPSFSNAFSLAINPYGAGTDTLAIGHGNLVDSIWHIDGSGNFGYGPNTENPVSYYEISKNRPNVNAPSDYELKLTLNTYGYVGSGYKLGMLQFLGGDTASAQDNFYAGIGSTALDGVNNSEEGSIDFHVKNGVSSTETLAVQIIGKAGAPLAGAGQVAKSTLFRYQGIAIDRVWANYPGISVLNSSDAGTNQGEFRFHGTNSASAAYPAASGSDFSVDVRADGSFISTSDRRAKTNITTIDNALSKVNQLTGKRFQRINRENQPQEHLSKNGYKFGFIAQEIEDIIPEAVKYHASEDDGTENWNSSYAMDYGSVVALLVNAIKEQDVVIQDLKTRIETLENA